MRWRELLRLMTRELQAAGIEQARFEARLLATAAAGISLEALVRDANGEATPEQERAVRQSIARRARREPASQILGWREFWGLRFAVDASVLTPRPDSETLIEAVLAVIPDRDRRCELLDLGTGSGCLAIALLSELPNARALAVDISGEALAVARRNAHANCVTHRLELRRADWTEGLDRHFDVAISNPPYIATAEIDALEPEVARHEPRVALDGGSDGLEAYRQLAEQLPTILCDGAVVAMEVGARQAADVCQILEQKGFSELSRLRDLAGIERVVRARWLARVPRPA